MFSEFIGIFYSLSFKTPGAPLALKAKRTDQISTPAIARRLILTNKFGQSPFAKAEASPRTPNDRYLYSDYYNLADTCYW